MSTETSDVEAVEIKDKKLLKRIYYNSRYAVEPEFRQREIDRNCIAVKARYNNNPEVKERMKANALARYYRLKQEKQAQKEQTVN